MGELLNCLKEDIKHYQNDHLIREQIFVDYRKANIISFNGVRLINFASNDYLSIATDDRIKQAVNEGTALYGLGSSASALVTSYLPLRRLEEKFAIFLDRDDAMLFNTGYLANIGVITTLARCGVSIVADKLCHASIADGIKLSQSSYYRYKHQSLDHAEQKIVQAGDNCLLITESIFSMEGNITRVDKFAVLASKYNANFIIDDAHGIGILGKNGKGICEYYNLSQQDTPCLIIPLSKAFGSFGAIVAGDKYLIKALKQFTRNYIYTNALPPAIAYASLRALEITCQEDWRRQKLQTLIIFFTKYAKSLGLSLCSEDPTPIKSIIVGSNINALFIQHKLKEKGFFISCIRPPTVEKGSARIRILINCMHTEQEIMHLLDYLASAMEVIS